MPERTGYFRSWGQTGCATSVPANAALDPLQTCRLFLKTRVSVWFDEDMLKEILVRAGR